MVIHGSLVCAPQTTARPRDQRLRTGSFAHPACQPVVAYLVSMYIDHYYIPMQLCSEHVSDATYPVKGFPVRMCDGHGGTHVRPYPTALR